MADPFRPNPPASRLEFSQIPSPEPTRPSRRRRPRRSRWLQAAAGLALAGAGSLLLVALMLIPERLDAVLLVSTAIANVLGGLSRLGLGFVQLGAVLLVALLALLALLLLLGGLVRLVRALVPPVSRASAATTGRPTARTTRGN
jgi:hypothetical protein